MEIGIGAPRLVATILMKGKFIDISIYTSSPIEGDIEQYIKGYVNDIEYMSLLAENLNYKIDRMEVLGSLYGKGGTVWGYTNDERGAFCIESMEKYLEEIGNLSILN